MKKLFVIITLSIFPFLASAASLTGRIVSVTDGDTVKLLTASKELHKIRLSGIDAPERSQPFGASSKLALSECSFNKIAKIEANKEDRYGRHVGKVIVDGVDCNLKQIELGMAWHYKKYEHEQEVEDRSIYSQAEYLARKDTMGLWRDSNAVAPWQWRPVRTPKI